MARGPLAAAELATYPRDGFALARGLFDAREVGLLHRAAKEDKALDDHSFGRRDGEVFETLDIFEAWLRSPVPVA